eukprot:10686642-Prorocentrum_lima.AAC.1
MYTPDKRAHNVVQCQISKWTCMAEVAMIVTHRLGFEVSDWLGVVIAPITRFPNFNVLECPYEG